MKIGFIGVGVMGAPMVQNLMKKGHELSVYNRTKEKAAGVVAAGAKWCESAGACAKDQDVVITIVGYPKDVEEVYFAPGGSTVVAPTRTICGLPSSGATTPPWAPTLPCGLSSLPTAGVAAWASGAPRPP